MRRVIGMAWTWATRGGLALLAWLVVAEAVELHWTLGLAAVLLPGPTPLEAPVVENTSLRLYADPRPHVGKITALQKGLVWAAQGRELIEEGYGFGCPIVQIEGKGYCSRHAQTEVLSTAPDVRLVKRYTIDTLDTPVQFLQPKYRPVASRGTVNITYSIEGQGIIDVDVDLSALAGGWERVFLMNEQGASTFRYYRAADGRRYEPHEVGIWELGGAEQGCFESKDGQYAFCVQPGEADEVYFGRERYLQYNWRGIYYLSWAGIDLAVDGPRDSFHYRVVLLAR